jgi:predicted transposase YbfD/YdcC
LQDVKGRRFLACDGKVLRGSFDNFHDKTATQLLSIFCTSNALSKKLFKESGETNGVIAQVKGNQVALLGDCKLVARVEKADDTFTEETQKSHGRMEQRTVEVYRDFIAKDEEWNTLLKELIVVKRPREVFDTKKKYWADSSEVSYYVCDVQLTAKLYNKAIREHWGVENKNNYVRDNTIGEDKSRIRINPINVAILRSTAMNVNARAIIAILWVNVR